MRLFLKEELQKRYETSVLVPLRDCWNLRVGGDVQQGKMNTVELLRQDAESRTASSGGIDIVLFSGDAVKYGSRYDNWQQWNGSPTVTNYMFAMFHGNKEYYYTGSSTFYDYYWYLAVKNNPPNGPGTTEQEGCANISPIFN